MSTRLVQGVCAAGVGLSLALAPAMWAGAAAQRGGQVTPDDPHYDLEQLYHQGRFSEGRALALEQLEDSPNDVSLLLHALRFSYELAEALPRDTTEINKERWYTEMLALAERAHALSPGDPHVRFARGLSRARLGTTRGVVSSMSMLSEVEADWLAAAGSISPYMSLGGEEVQPCDTWLALGVLYRLMPERWALEAVAGTRGDLDKAVAWLEKANHCAPGRIEPLKELGAAQLCYATRRDDDVMRDSGARTLKAALSLAPTKPTDEVDLKHAALLLDDPSLACAYSRDGLAEADRRQLGPATPTEAQYQ